MIKGMLIWQKGSSEVVILELLGGMNLVDCFYAGDVVSLFRN